MNQKKLITILATITIIAIMSVSLFFTQLLAATATTYNPDNLTVTGVLATDSYVLYPYAKKSLTFGISKYGEMINGAASPEVGLKYDGLDVFANPNVLESDWSQGWFIDIHYAGEDNSYKRLWAFAMYSDLSGSLGIGGDWKENCTLGPTGLPQGGRKTSAWAATDDIEILYDGPREFIALTNTTLYEDSAETKAMVSITITFVFNKVKKHVTLFKDVKRRDLGKWGRTFQVEFSNRGEWDIGTTASPPAYAHFYDNLATLYNHSYHDFYSVYNVTGFDAAQMISTDGHYVGFTAFWPPLFGKLVDGTGHITRSDVLSSLCTKMYNRTWLLWGSPANKSRTFASMGFESAESYPRGDGLWSDEPMVFKNGILLSGGGVDYTWTPSTDTLEFTIEPLDADYIIIVYKHETNADSDDLASHATEPDTPYVIGEWCFDLEDEDRKRQFRGVTLYGVTDRHDADDDDASAAAWSGQANQIDCEVQYYLNETFNPYDLYSAVHKQESRWVDIRNLTSTATYLNLTDGLDDTNYYNITAGWQPYYISPERWTGSAGAVNSTWMNEFEDGIDAHSKNWALNLSATVSQSPSQVEMLQITPKAGTPTTAAPLTLQFKDLVDIDFWYYHTSQGWGGSWGPWMEFNVTNTANPATATAYVNIQSSTNNPNTAAGWKHWTLNTIDDFIPAGGTPDGAWNIADSVGVTNDGLWHSFEYYSSMFADYYVHYVGVGQAYGASLIDDVSIAFLTNDAGKRHERVYNMEEDKLVPTDWDEYCSFAERVLVNGTLIERYAYANTSVAAGARESYYTINFETGGISFYHWSSALGYHLWTLGINTHIKVLYSTIEECTKGRYEWMVVGKDSAPIDSIGAAYMTEAFDSRKDIEVQVTALDINDTVYGPHVPFVMAGAVTGTKADYRDSLGRPHLRDDWCTTYPIASSNMLFSGGPLANLGAEYFNEFTRAMWARSDYVVNDTGHASTIFAVSCWNRQNYTSTLSALYGYAVVSVYKDINGTIGFLIWGHEGQDTYYATKWFWDEGIVYLQTENRGVTDIILRIRYPTADPTHPVVSLVERLGTISEKTPHDC